MHVCKGFSILPSLVGKTLSPGCDIFLMWMSVLSILDDDTRISEQSIGAVIVRNSNDLTFARLFHKMFRHNLFKP